MPTQRPSELESFVLGLLWQIGPSSPYDLRRHMLASPSTQWSASAGAIYPLMRRLESVGLLSSAHAQNGKRERRVYSITPPGKSALKQWIGPPLAADAVSVMYDPMRSRARFLGALPKSQRAAWLKTARAALDQVEANVRSWHEQFGDSDDPFRALMTRHGELDVQMRRKWLDELERLLAAVA